MGEQIFGNRFLILVAILSYFTSCSVDVEDSDLFELIICCVLVVAGKFMSLACQCYQTLGESELVF